MRSVRTLIVILAMLAVPAVAMAKHTEVGAGAPTYHKLSGTDLYGAVHMTVESTSSNGAPAAVGDLTYASACSRTGVKVTDEQQGTAFFLAGVNAKGLFAWRTGGSAVSGIVTLAHGTYTVRASVQSARSCGGAPGPVTFTLTG